MGRVFGETDEPANAPAVALVSPQTWRRRFGSDPSIIGRTVRLNGTPVTVVGGGAKGYNGSGAGFFVCFFYATWVAGGGAG